MIKTIIQVKFAVLYLYLMHLAFPQIGSVGHAVVENIHRALNIWSIHHHQNIHYITKGQNCLTEMYSVIEAEVPVR